MSIAGILRAVALARIRLQQPPSADVPPGISRRDLVAGIPVILRNGDDTGVTRWNWTLLYKPPGSTAVIQNPNSAVATLTPDVRGASYRLQLSINRGRKSHGEVQIIVFRVPDGAGLALPAVGERGSESNYLINGNPNTASWADEFVRFYLKQFNNQGAAFSQAIANGAGHTFVIPWTLPFAMLKYLSLRSTVSIDVSVRFYADAGLTQEVQMLGVGMVNLDATAGYTFTAHHTLGTFTEGSIYLRVTNADANTVVTLSLWLGAI